MEIIYTIEQLVISLEVAGATYDMAKKNATMTLRYVVGVRKSRVTHEVQIQVQVDEPSLAGVEKVINKKRKRLEEVAINITKSVESLLALAQYVEVDLHQILARVLSEVENIEIKK